MFFLSVFLSSLLVFLFLSLSGGDVKLSRYAQTYPAPLVDKIVEAIHATVSG